MRLQELEKLRYQHRLYDLKQEAFIIAQEETINEKQRVIECTLDELCSTTQIVNAQNHTLTNQGGLLYVKDAVIKQL